MSMFDLARAMYEQPQENAGVLTMADMDAFLESMFTNARSEPDIIYVSVEDMRGIRHWQRIDCLYRAHPTPPRKIRKCHMRKLQVHWRSGKQRIARIEKQEAEREAKEIQRMEADRT